MGFNSGTSWKDNMTTDQIAECLLEDMEQLRNEEWQPDAHTIAAHCELISELQRRANGD